MKVCVVGFGPAGCVVAIALAKQGHKVEIFERDASPNDMDLETLKERSYPMISIIRGPDILEQVNLRDHFERSKFVVSLKGMKFKGEETQTTSQEGFGGSRQSFMRAYLEGLQIECP